MQPMVVSESIQVDAPAERVWQVLTQPEFTRQYMFGCEARTDWKRGSPLLWAALHEGKDTVFVQGHITHVEPNRALDYTTFGPTMGLEDVPENYLAVSIRFTPNAAGVHLAVTQGDFAGKQNAQARFDETLEGWRSVLPRVKALAEAR
jgi:uncharacterized protein YndB with AHSA1/START domain